MKLHFLSIALFGSALPLCAQSVLTVDDDGPAAYSTIQAAVDAAQDGDVILVSDGQYGGVTIDGKSVVVTGNFDSLVDVQGTFVVRNLADDQQVVLSWLGLFGGGPGGALDAQDNQGSLRVESAFINSKFGSSAAGSMNVANSGSVVLYGCTIRGDQVSGAGGYALRSTDSELFLYSCDLRGGAGATASIKSWSGGDALIAVDSAIFLSGSTLTGGPGGAGQQVHPFTPACSDGGDGGAGMRLIGSSTLVQNQESLFLGGFPGFALEPGCFDGVAGIPASFEGGALLNLPSPARRFYVETPFREQESVRMTFDAKPDELAFLGVSVNPAQLLIPALGGADLLGDPTFFLFVGQLDGTGHLETEMFVGDFGNPAREVASLYEQALFFGAVDGVTLGEGRHVVYLDSAF